MKALIFLLLVLVAVLLPSCKKDQETENPMRKIMGTYIGSTQVYRQFAEEVWSSPTSFHFETRYDTTYTPSDTLMLEQIGRDSFMANGPAAEYLFWGPYHFSSIPNASTDSLLFEKEIGSSGYFMVNVKLVVDPVGETATLEQISDQSYYDRPDSKSRMVFHGTRQ